MKIGHMYPLCGIHLSLRQGGKLANKKLNTKLIITGLAIKTARRYPIFGQTFTTCSCRTARRKVLNKEISVPIPTVSRFGLYSSRQVFTRRNLSNSLKTASDVFLTNQKQVFDKYSTFRRVNRKTLGKLTTMKLESPEFRDLFTPELEVLVSLFNKYGYELRIAGGAVRDLINGTLPSDIDFATTATPDQMKTMFEAEQIRMINTKGEKHGTITARINDKENFEVTTLRIDVETDGRHAKVEFTKDWRLDANRRDLTVNAMFLGFDGTVYDYFNGKEDLEQRKVCFVGDAAERIKEDYLRILRYFRFCGRICKTKIEHDPDALAAIRENMQGLSGISGERIWSELKKIVTGEEADCLMETMIDLEITPYIGLPAKPNVAEFMRVWQRASLLKPLPMTMMSALLHSESQVNDLNQRLKLSTDEVKLGYFIVHNRLERFDSDPLRTAQNIMVDSAGKDSKVKERLCELFKYKGHEDILKSFSAWEPPKFPVTGYDLVSVKVPKGPVFAKTLNELRQLWKESNFSLSKEDLMSHVDEIVLKLKT